MANELARRKLGAVAPPDTNNWFVAVPSQPNWRYTVEEIVVANVTAASHDFRIFHDKDRNGAIGTALIYDAPLAANSQVRFEGKWYVNPGEGIGVRSDLASALTFSVFGIVEELSNEEIENLE